MVHLKNKCMVQLVIILVFAFSFCSFILANPGYKILSYQGKVKVKKNNKIIPLIAQVNIHLKKDDAVMVYPGSIIEMVFPGGNRKVFAGPLYSDVENLDKSFESDLLSFFEKPARWKGIERIFDEEGEETIGKSTQEVSLILYDEIKQVVLEAKVEDKRLTPHKEKEMREISKTAEHGFNTFSETKQILIRALVYKVYGLDKKALNMVFSYYEKIFFETSKQLERELMEDYLLNRYLPIVITILPDDEDKKFNKTFSSNFKLYWGAFFFDGKKLETLEKTIDYSRFPRDNFTISKDIPVITKTKSAFRSKYSCVFVVASTDWTELERFDVIGAAEKNLLENGTGETKSNTIMDYGKVIIKLCL